MDKRIRDALVLVGTFAALLGGLYLYTNVWPPAVIVESGSMMHADADVRYGRFGTIDPGDLVLVKKVDGPADVTTLVEGGRDRYGKPGDVLIYFRGGNHAVTPIIHRAVAYVEVVDADGSRAYRVRWAPDAACEGGATKDPIDARWCVYGSDGVLVPSIPIADANGGPFRPDRTGFLTKGDNPVTNRATDQLLGLAPGTIQLSWIQGKARGEVPWLGLLKLAFGSQYNERECLSGPVRILKFETLPSGSCKGWFGIGHALAPKDVWAMLGVSLLVLVGTPVLLDVWKMWREKRATSRP